jgi:hypothetical protein
VGPVREGVHELAGNGRDPAHALDKIEGHPLGHEEASRGPLNGPQGSPSVHPFPFGNEQRDVGSWIHRVEDVAEQIPAAADQGSPGDSGSASENKGGDGCEGGDVTGTEVFFEVCR